MSEWYSGYHVLLLRIVWTLIVFWIALPLVWFVMAIGGRLRGLLSHRQRVSGSGSKGDAPPA